MLNNRVPYFFSEINEKKSPHHHLSKNTQRFAVDASNSIYKSALEETKKDLGEAIDSAVEAYTEKTIGNLMFDDYKNIEQLL